MSRINTSLLLALLLSWVVIACLMVVRAQAQESPLFAGCETITPVPSSSEVTIVAQVPSATLPPTNTARPTPTATRTTVLLASPTPTQTLTPYLAPIFGTATGAAQTAAAISPSATYWTVPPSPTMQYLSTEESFQNYRVVVNVLNIRTSPGISGNLAGQTKAYSEIVPIYDIWVVGDYKWGRITPSGVYPPQWVAIVKMNPNGTNAAVYVQAVP